MSSEHERDLVDDIEISDEVKSSTANTQYGVIPYRVVIRELIVIKDTKIDGNIV